MKKCSDRVAPKSSGKASVFPKSKANKNAVSHFKEYNQKDQIADNARDYTRGIKGSEKLSKGEKQRVIPKSAKMKSKVS